MSRHRHHHPTEIRLRISSDVTLRVTASGIYLRTSAGPSITVEPGGITLDSGGSTCPSCTSTSRCPTRWTRTSTTPKPSRSSTTRR